MSATAVVLAAGAGTRLGDIGRRHSKAMLPVAGRPLIDWVIERLCAGGVDRLVVVAHSSDDDLGAFLAAHHPKAALVRQHERRGIAHALRLALRCLDPAEAYLACACDSLFESADIARLIARGRASHDAAVVGVLEMGPEATSSRSAVRLAGDRLMEIVEKPPPGSMATGLVAMPLYWLTPEASGHLAKNAREGEHYVTTSLSSFIATGGTVLAHRVRTRLEITGAADIPLVEAALARR